MGLGPLQTEAARDELGGKREKLTIENPKRVKRNELTGMEGRERC